MIHISDIIINLTRKHLNQLNLYNLQFMRIEFNITADVWNLTPNCWKSGSIIFRQGYLICECVFKIHEYETWEYNLYNLLKIWNLLNFKVNKLVNLKFVLIPSTIYIICIIRCNKEIEENGTFYKYFRS